MAAAGTARRMVSSLYQRNYRLFFFGQLISVVGTWMQSVAQSFLVLDLTHSGTDLGLTMAARFGPMLVFGVFGGVIADRLDKRRVMYVTQTLAGLMSGLFAVFIATGTIRMWIIYLLSVALGFVNVFDNPARQAFISELVTPADLSNAVTLNSVAMNLARVLGGAAGGTIAGVLGLAPCFTVNAASFAAVLVSLALMRAGEMHPARRVARERGQVLAGLRYVRGDRALLVPMVMIAVIGTLVWEFQVTLPLMATQVFHRGPEGYGLMSSVMGVGAVIGGMVATARRRPGRLAFAALGWGLAIVVAALAPSLPAEIVALLFVGYGSLTFNSYAKTALQLSADPQMRGRVMALWALAWLGSTPVGGPIVGWLGQVAGARWALLIGGIACLACGLWALPALGRRPVAGEADEAGQSVSQKTPATLTALCDDESQLRVVALGRVVPMDNQIAVGLVFMVIPGLVVGYNMRLQRRGHRTTGVVADVERQWDPTPDSGGYTYWPVLEFQTDTGQDVRTRAKVSGSPQVGRRVPVLYDPDNPQTAEIDTIWGRGTIAFGAFALIGLYLIVSAILGKHR